PLPTEAPADTPAEAVEPSAAASSEAPVASGTEAPVEPTPEAPAEPEAKPAEVAPVEAQAPAPPAPLTYEPFTMPEGVTADEPILGEFTKTLGEAQVPQEVGQSLIDLHGRVMRQAVEAEEQRQRDVWDQTRAGWRKDVQTAFGNQYDTRLNDAR